MGTDSTQLDSIPGDISCMIIHSVVLVSALAINLSFSFCFLFLEIFCITEVNIILLPILIIWKLTRLPRFMHLMW